MAQRALSRASRSVPGAVLAVLSAGLAAPAAAQMPDPRAMHGQAIPAAELPAGSITVRVVRQALGNNVAGAGVELHGAGDVRRAVTGADGRATFSGVPPGASVHAIATVDGERLESTVFEVPRAGGVRAILVAGLGLGSTGGPPAAVPAPPPAVPAPPAAGAPASPGRLTLGNNSRIAIEFQDDTITVFYLLDVVNQSGAPVALQAPLTFELPPDAMGATKLDGASPLVTVSGRDVSLVGPVPPGVTAVPVAYRIERWGARHTIEQRFPLPMSQIAVGVQRLAGLSVESPQAGSVREASLSGQAFLIMTGSALGPGEPLRVSLVGLPHRSRTPLVVALALAGLVALGGVYLAVRRPTTAAARQRETLEQRRRKGLAALAALDAAHRRGGVADAAYADKRARLVADLERIYAELDAFATPPDGDRGLAA